MADGQTNLIEDFGWQFLVGQGMWYIPTAWYQKKYTVDLLALVYK